MGELIIALAHRPEATICWHKFGVICQTECHCCQARYIGGTGKLVCTNLHGHELADRMKDKLSLISDRTSSPGHKFNLTLVRTLGQANAQVSRQLHYAWLSIEDTIAESIDLPATYLVLRERINDVTQEQIDEIRLRPEREMLEDLEKRRAKGDDLSQLDSQGAAPMDIIELLVAYGADMNLPTQSGQTVYTISDSKDLRERLSDIWARRDELMRGVKRQPLGFQNSRSSVRRRSSMVLRRSVREKRNLTVMEARLEKQLGEREEAKLAQEMSNGLESLPLSVQSPSFTTTLAPTTTMVSNSQNVSPPVQPPPRANSSNKTVSSAGVIGEGQQITNFRNPDIDRGDHLLPRVSQNRFLEAPEVPNNATSDSKLCTMPPMPPPRAKKNGASDSTKNRNSSPQCSGPTSPAVNNSPADSNFSSLDKPPMSEKKTLAALARGSVTTPATSASPSSSVDSTSTEQAAKPRRIPPRDYILPVTDERTSPRRIVNGSGRRVKQIPANSPSHGDGSAVSETLRTDTPSNPTSLKGSNPSNGQQAQQTNVDTRRRYSVDNTRQENSPSGSHKTSINIPRPSGLIRGLFSNFHTIDDTELTSENRSDKYGGGCINTSKAVLTTRHIFTFGVPELMSQCDEYYRSTFLWAEPSAYCSVKRRVEFFEMQIVQRHNFIKESQV
ncbi:unnamed protein product [Schistocephalus solidus]|uniref:ANK_REP_REGION domain-containing protein n=1 Tax=Schistocephalus solidus TaxID=70667 RepID=A0A183T043_SCHSO|nr:unnamed protein product [Schistocephalus solidus]